MPASDGLDVALRGVQVETEPDMPDYFEAVRQGDTPH